MSLITEDESKAEAHRHSAAEQKLGAGGLLHRSARDGLRLKDANPIDLAATCERPIDPRERACGTVTVRRWNLGGTPRPRVDGIAILRRIQKCRPLHGGGILHPASELGERSRCRRRRFARLSDGSRLVTDMNAVHVRSA